MITLNIVPTIEVLSQVLGCLQLPSDASLKKRIVENLGVISDTSNLCSLIDGFGEYDPRAFSLLEVSNTQQPTNNNQILRILITPSTLWW